MYTCRFVSIKTISGLSSQKGLTFDLCSISINLRKNENCSARFVLPTKQKFNIPSQFSLYLMEIQTKFLQKIYFENLSFTITMNGCRLLIFCAPDFSNLFACTLLISTSSSQELNQGFLSISLKGLTALDYHD
mgnify:CR=1 FL=1